jgi:hypothetical protein
MSDSDFEGCVELIHQKLMDNASPTLITKLRLMSVVDHYSCYSLVKMRAADLAPFQASWPTIIPHRFINAITMPYNWTLYVDNDDGLIVVNMFTKFSLAQPQAISEVETMFRYWLDGLAYLVDFKTALLGINSK